MSNELGDDTHGKPLAFHLMVKPTGAACNLNCSYCFYLGKKSLYPGSRFRMTDGVLESYTRQLIDAHQVQRVTFAWQGGEPTLMGLAFFRKAMDLQNKYRKPGMTFENTLQTNGVLLDDALCEFLSRNHFLVGISLDGPQELHDACRKDISGQGTYARVIAGLRLLQKHKVDYNVLIAVSRVNAAYPTRVYRFLRDEIEAQYLQFIPIVEKSLNLRGAKQVTDQSVRPEQWGHFLIDIFDEWVRRDVGRTFVLNFDGALAGWLGKSGTLCIFGRTCGLGLALEHNGDLYSCDHFVDPEHILGNILDTQLLDMVDSERQRKFSRDKWDSLPEYCLTCQFLTICNGECPKNRFCETPDGKPGLNYLCVGYRSFFKHAETNMKLMAKLIRLNRPADEITLLLAQQEEERNEHFARAGRNQPCPCGSGLKFKKCHGRISPH
jgi:uncharacterized protein